MPLQAHGCNGNSLGLQLRNECDRPFALGFIFQRVVVVGKLRLRVGFVRVLKGLLNVVFADDLAATETGAGYRLRLALR